MRIKYLIGIIFVISLITTGFIGIFRAFKQIDIDQAKRKQDFKSSIIDCQSRGNDIGWCLEVIK